ncbi:hypothetical protein EYZ11_000710 [Aspergillus tanneri]|uniref:Uncharacterized protein n=1 Tax=Aspergillus tanneri TaxID=1220188 RepID=A0A4V3UQR6_9EURO|nr:hypothetical protein EYZ11_000710 [Aspergillus tanneri]
MTQDDNALNYQHTDIVHESTLEDLDLERKNEKSNLEEFDTFGDEEFAEVKYKVLNWWQVKNPQATITPLKTT